MSIDSGNKFTVNQNWIAKFVNLLVKNKEDEKYKEIIKQMVLLYISAAM